VPLLYLWSVVTHCLARLGIVVGLVRSNGMHCSQVVLFGGGGPGATAGAEDSGRCRAKVEPLRGSTAYVPFWLREK